MIDIPSPSRPRQAGRSLSALTMLVGAYLLAMAIAFRPLLLSGLDMGFGDRGDGIIEISLLEHWHRLFTGGAGHWRQTLYFHPYADTLGYNDSYLLFGIVYSFWRQWFDPFLSDGLNMATWKTLGFFASYALARRSLKWERPVALLIAFLFTIANGMMVRAGHAQLQAVALLPVTAIVTIALFRAELSGSRRRTMAMAACLALIFGLWFMTGYYMAWFTLYFTVIGSLCWFATLGRQRWTILRQFTIRHGRTFGLFFIFFLLAIIPFLWTYLAKLTETGGHNYGTSYYYLPTMFDPINVGPDNLLWGWIASLVQNGVNGLTTAMGGTVNSDWITDEHETGFPLVLLFLALAAAWKILRDKRPDNRTLHLFALTVLTSWALTIKLEYDFSPWHAVYILIPGAKGLRVVLRYQLWLILPVLLLVAAAWRERFMALIRTRPVAASAILLLLVAEQLTAAPSAMLSRSLQIRDFARITPMPKECPAFYVISARPADTVMQAGGADPTLYPHNVDAMFLASFWSRPTINGFSTFNPPDWDFAKPDALDYDSRVARYAKAHGLRILCRLDARTEPQWRVVHYGRKVTQ